MQNKFLFVYQRSGSGLVTALLEHRGSQALKEWEQRRARNESGEPIGTIASVPPYESEHLIGPNEIQTLVDTNKQDRLFCKLWYTYIGNWWGAFESYREIPLPYSGECAMRWGEKELVEIEKIPDATWNWAVMLRDPRTQLESVRNAPGERKLIDKDPEDYFKQLCIGARNRCRVILDCEKHMVNYKIFRFEDLVINPIDTAIAIINHFGLDPDVSQIKENYQRHMTQVDLVKKSSFKEAGNYFNRHHCWSSKERDWFDKLAGKEIEELGYSWED